MNYHIDQSEHCRNGYYANQPLNLCQSGFRHILLRSQVVVRPPQFGCFFHQAELQRPQFGCLFLKTLLAKVSATVSPSINSPGSSGEVAV